VISFESNVFFKHSALFFDNLFLLKLSSIKYSTNVGSLMDIVLYVVLV